MPSLDDFVRDASPRERAELGRVLDGCERLFWAARPVPPFWRPSYVFHEFVAVCLLGYVGYCCFSGGLSSAGMGHLLLLLVLAVLGIFLAVTPWRCWYRWRCTLYVLTNRRALLMQPGRLQSFLLEEEMVRSRLSRPRGGGDLFFEAERGFIYLPNLQDAQQKIREAYASLLADMGPRGC